MTSQPQPSPGEGKTADQYLRQLRDLAAYVLVGATAVLLFGAVLQVIPDGSGQFGYRTQASFGAFVNLPTIFFPLGAVLLSVLVRPQHPKAQLIVLAAVVEYAVAAVFGLFFGVLIGLINQAADDGARRAFEGLLHHVAWLAVFAVAAYAVFLIWRNLFYTPRPKPQPGVYGKPQYPAPGAFPDQPGYGPPPAGYQQPGQQAYGPGTYGQPAPAWNQPSGPYAAFGQPTQPVPSGPHPGVQAGLPTPLDRREVEHRTARLRSGRAGPAASVNRRPPGRRRVLCHCAHPGTTDAPGRFPA